jgi:hypothetical protein
MSWDSSEIPTAKDIHFAKQQRLAELESSGEIALAIQNCLYSKDDIIKAFDNILSDVYLPYHFHVEKDTALLHFLETGNYSSDIHFASSGIYDDMYFGRWLAPYFAAAFATFLKISFDEPNAEKLASLLQENIKVTEDYEEAAWEPVRKELLKSASYLELYYDSFSWIEQGEHILQMTSISFLQLVSLKPEYLFYDETYEYTRLLYNIAAVRNVPPHIAFCILHNLLNLNLKDNLKRLCRENMPHWVSFPDSFYIQSRGIQGRWAVQMKIPDNKDSRHRATEKSTSSVGSLLFGIFSGILMLVIFAKSCESYDNEQYKYNAPSFPSYKMEDIIKSQTPKTPLYKIEDMIKSRTPKIPAIPDIDTSSILHLLKSPSTPNKDELMMDEILNGAIPTRKRYMGKADSLINIILNESKKTDRREILLKQLKQDSLNNKKNNDKR